MSITSSTYTGGMLVTNYDNSKMFLFQNEYIDGQINNSDYVDLVVPIGTLVGRVSATGLLLPLASGASDGSQFPVGIVAGNYTIADGTTANVRICVTGEVDEDKIVFQGSDTLETVVSDRRLRDRIMSDTSGIVLKTVTDLSELDNQ